MLTFVDTGVWYASVVPTDPRHADVIRWLRENNPPLLTSDYVVDETLTLLRARGEPARAIALGRSFFDLRAVQVHYLEQADILRAWQVFSQNPNREWSFTDCTSRAVIERFHIKRAFTFDQHFSEFGVTAVVP